MSTVIEDRRRPVFGLQHRLALAREVAGIDQLAMSHALGCTRPTVSNYERGFTMPRRSVLVAWALATGVDVEWLETGNEKPHQDGPDGASLPGLDSNQEPAGFQPDNVIWADFGSAA